MPAPTNPAATPVDADSITLTWSAAAGASHYDIERNGVIIASDVVGLTYTDNGVTLADEHDYRVRAVYTTVPGFNPETDITWHSLFWAEGTAFTALGLADGATVTTWPNETGESNATGTGPVYRAAGINEAQPSLDFSTQGLTSSAFSTPPDYTSGVSVVVIAAADVLGGDRRIVDGIAGRNIVYAQGSGYGIYAGSFVNGTSNKNPLGYSALLVGWFDGAGGSDWLDVDDVRDATGNAGSGQLTGISIGHDLSSSTVYPWDGDVALVGIYEGDITTDPAWSSFVAWADSYYQPLPLTSPADIDGLVGWWDASDTLTITESGGAVSQWDDKSGSGLHVTQSTAGKKPTTGVGTQNGLNYMSFDSTDKLKKSGHTPICETAYSAFYVFRKTGAANTYESAPMTLTSGNSARPLDWWNGTAWGPITSSRQDGVSVTVNFQTSTAWNQVTLMGGDGTTTDQVITIGSRDDEVTQLTGDIAEILIYDVELDMYSRDRVEKYLRDKWMGNPLFTGGAISIPGDGYVYHEFRSSGTLTPVADPVEVEYVVVAGGGGGGTNQGGGGGAGGLKSGTATIASAQTATIGGAGGPGVYTVSKGVNGTASSLGPISSTGGGGGGNRDGAAGIGDGNAGGSGGGGGGDGTSRTAGTGIAGQGYDGGDGATFWTAGGGGGGAGGVGTDADSANPTAAPGGSGATGWWTGTLARGGDGGPYAGTPEAKTANTGDGGDGGLSGAGVGTTGGSGITIVRYPVDYAWAGYPEGITPAAWYDADDASTIVLDSGKVSAWLDKSPNGYHMLQTTAARRPLYTASWNGGYAIEMSNADQTWMTNNAPATATPITVFCVHQCDSYGSSGWNGIWTWSADGYGLTRRNNGEQVVGINWASTTGQLALVNSKVIWTAKCDGASSVYRVNGSALTGGGVTSGTTGSTGMKLGTRYGGGGGTEFNGKYKEVLVYTSALSSGEITAIEGYLNTKCGVY